MKNKLLAAPYIVWMAIFILVPLGIVVYYALTDSITGQFTLANLASIGSYLPIFLRSIWLSLFAAFVNFRHGRPGYLHPFGAHLVRQLFQIDQTNDLKFIHRQHDGIRLRRCVRRKLRKGRLLTDLSTFLRSWHILAS